MTKEYMLIEVVTTDKKEFETFVNDAIQHGFKPHGNFQMLPVMSKSKLGQPMQLIMYSQPMVKKDVDEKLIKCLKILDTIGKVGEQEINLNNPISE